MEKNLMDRTNPETLVHNMYSMKMGRHTTDKNVIRDFILHNYNQDEILETLVNAVVDIIEYKEK